MRIHLGHHFYGAGNLGDDFMLAGFLAAAATLAPGAELTCCVPFALEPLRQRFPQIRWLPYDEAERERCIAACDAWLGLGGSPFQHAQSRWFVDHLEADAARCQQHGKPMYFLGIGVQSAAELADAVVQRLCAQAAAIWTRDAESAARLAALPAPPATLARAADLAHLFFRTNPPPAAAPGRLTLVANFDYGTWPGQAELLRATEALPVREHVWLAQESRPLPGAEHALFAALPETERSRWTLVSPEDPGAPLPSVMARWPSGEWLVTARFHAALAGAWAGSKVVVLLTNEKLRGVADLLGCPTLSPAADEPAARLALTAATAPSPALLSAEADRIQAACAAFFQRLRPAG